MSRNRDAALGLELAVIHQAIGMVMAQLDVAVGVAAERLHEYAAGVHRSVVDVARDVVAHRLDLSG